MNVLVAVGLVAGGFVVGLAFGVRVASRRYERLITRTSIDLTEIMRWSRGEIRR